MLSSEFYEALFKPLFLSLPLKLSLSGQYCKFPFFRHLPQIYQSFVTSATMWDDVKKLKKLILNKPVILRLEEPPLPTTTQLTQYVIKVKYCSWVIPSRSCCFAVVSRGRSSLDSNFIESMKMKNVENF